MHAPQVVPEGQRDWVVRTVVRHWLASSGTRLGRDVTGHPDPDGRDVSGEILGTAEGVHVRGDGAQRRLVTLNHVHDAQVRVDRQAAGVPAGAAGRQHVVGACQVVAQRDGGVGADEDRAGVADPCGDLRRLLGLDLQVLGRPGVGDGDGRVKVVGDDVAGLATQGGLDPFPVPGGFELAGDLLVHLAWQGRVGGDEEAAGVLVVLSLADQVGGDEPRIGGVVGDDGDLGQASPSMPTTPCSSRLAAAT